ncbi:MAG TPA: histidine phosphatase family protein [Candidatus Tumulicola sp.]
MIVLCRHGATDANAGGAFLSASDPPLNQLGATQASLAADALRDAGFNLVVTSPKLRCRQTCAIVAPSIEARVDTRLIEVNFGEWEGRTKAWLEEHEADALRRRRESPVHFTPPGGESFAQVAVRLRPLADELRDDRADRILVVAHRGTLGVLERLLRGVSLDSQTVVPMEPGEFRTLEAVRTP